MSHDTTDDRAEGASVRDPTPDSPPSGLNDRAETGGLSGVGAFPLMDIFSERAWRRKDLDRHVENLIAAADAELDG